VKNAILKREQKLNNQPCNTFTKLPKKLLKDDKFKNLSHLAQIMIIYLLAFSNNYRGALVWKMNTDIHSLFKISKTSMWRVSQELLILNIRFYSRNKRYYFNLEEFLEEYSVPNMKQK